LNKFLKTAKFRERKVICALLAVLVLPVAANAATTLTPDHLAYYQQADEGARVQVLIRLAQSPQFEDAEILLQRFPLAGPHAANRTLFIQGLILEKRGQFSAAAAKFRAALASDPKLSMVRAELAQVLVKLGEDDSAKHHLELLAADAPTPQQANGIRSFVEQLDAQTPFKFSGFVSLAPSTNINEGSSHNSLTAPDGFDTATIDQSSQRSSGIGETFGGNVGYVKQLGEHFQTVLAAGAVASIYNDQKFDSLGLSQSAELRYLLQDGYVGLGAVATEGIDTIAMNVGYYSFGPRISFSKMLSQRDQLSGSATYEWRNPVGAPQANTTAFQSSATLTHALDESSNVALIAGYDNVGHFLPYNAYQAETFGLGFYKEVPWGVTVEGQGTARLAQFADGNPFVAGTPIRIDQRLTASTTLTKRDWNWFGFAPSVNYTYVRNFSNIELYDYDSHSVDFRLTKDF
jgi:outer membrane protein